MKLLNSILLRGIVTVILGLIFIIWPQSSVKTLIVIIGVCLVVTGLPCINPYHRGYHFDQPCRNSFFHTYNVRHDLVSVWC